MNLQDQKYYQKSKFISSAEPNYLSQFEMRYPVVQLTNQNLPTFGIKLCCNNKICLYQKDDICRNQPDYSWCMVMHISAYLLTTSRTRCQGRKKTHAREKNIIYFVSCNKKRKLFCILHFFSYFMMVRSKSNDKLISSLA